ncbi:MAG: hypothetical protein PVJ27_09200 [Candidatus Brocadiaceae bacterium]|jgi:hypothetical protein
MGFLQREERRRDPILAAIDGVRRSVLMRRVGWGYLWVVLLVAAMVFGGVLLDHLFVLQKWGRVAFFRAFIAACGAAALMATAYPLVRRIGRLYVARCIEENRPGLGNALISYLQTRGEARTPRELKVMLARRVAPHVKGLDGSVAVDSTPYVRVALAVTVVLVTFVLYTALSPKSAGVSLARLFMPRADILPPTATRLAEVEPGDIYVMRGSQPELRVRAEGLLPESVHAVWSGTSFERRRMLLSRASASTWRTTFPPLLEDGTYHIVAGDTRSDRFLISVLPKPVVERVRLEVNPPDYTGLPLRTLEEGSFEAVKGSEVRFRAWATLPPARGHLAFRSGRRAVLDAARGGNPLRTEFDVLRSDAYSVHFESVPYPNGKVFRNSSPIEYDITCREDQPPAVELKGPPDGVQMAPSATVRVIYSASDDFGISRVRLRHGVGGFFGAPVTIAQDLPRKVERAVYEWDLSTVTVSPGQTLTYYVEVEDNRPEVPHRVRSEARRIVIPGPERRPRPADARGAERPEPPARDARPPAERDQRRSRLREVLERLRQAREEADAARDEEASQRPEARQQQAREGEAAEGEPPQRRAGAQTDEAQGAPRPARPEEPKEQREDSEPCPKCGSSTCDGGGTCPGGAGAGQGAGDTGGAPAEGQGEQTGGQGVEPGGGGAAASPTAGSSSGSAERAPAGAAGARGEGVSAPPGEGPPERALPEGNFGRDVAELERMLEADELPDELLEDLGTNRRELREFIEEYRRRRPPTTGEPAPVEAPVEPLEPGQVMRTGRAESGFALADEPPGRPKPDELRSRFEGVMDRLSPRYREIVNQYYRTLSEE